MSFSTYDNTIICISAPNGTVGLADHPGANNVLFQLTDDAPCSLVRFSSGDDVLATARRTDGFRTQGVVLVDYPFLNG